MLWDPSFATWQALDVSANSQMIVLSAGLDQGSNLVYGFDETQRNAILELLEGI